MRGFEIVGGDFPKFILGNGVRRQAVADDGKNGKGQAVRVNFCGWREFALQTRDESIDALKREDHVAVPVEEEIDFGGAAAGDGLDFLQAGNAIDGFL